ncbi:hypothetical protein [Parafilimonas sp.]|uniref:hypothetical protein n=1 Tax=Parafilimonas sp. TaxID=1969739 RepID=UPI003F82039D
MNEFQDMIFISEILLQSKIAQRAFERLQATHKNFDRLEVWCSIQSILVSTANISKILWPGKNRVRGKRLRGMLKVEADNILSNRNFRNHFEHYDERIEDWFDHRTGGVYIDLAMNPSLRGGFDGNDHRGYNSFDNSLMFRGERLDLNNVLDALLEVHKNCKLYVLDIP